MTLHRIGAAPGQRPLGRRLLALAGLALLVGCGGGGPLARVDTLDGAQKDRLRTFSAELPVDRLAALAPDAPEQYLDLRPRALADSGLMRYVGLVWPAADEALAEFRAETGVGALQAFERLVFWNDSRSAPGRVVPTDDGGIVVHTEGRTLIALLRYLDTLSREAGDDDEGGGGPDGQFVFSVFAPMDQAQLAEALELAGRDAAIAGRHELGPDRWLFTLRFPAEEPPATMWLYVWPGGFIAERSALADVSYLPVAAERLHRRLVEVERAAGRPAGALPQTRVATMRFMTPAPMNVNLDVGDDISLQVSAPADDLDLDTPPSVLVAGWEVMKRAMLPSLGQLLTEWGVPSGFQPLAEALLVATRLSLTDNLLIVRVALSRAEFEGLLPTL